MPLSAVLFAILHRITPLFNRRGLMACVCWLLSSLCLPPAEAAPLEVLRVAAHRSSDGVYLDIETRFDLPPSVEEALQKAWRCTSRPRSCCAARAGTGATPK